MIVKGVYKMSENIFKKIYSEHKDEGAKCQKVVNNQWISKQCLPATKLNHRIWLI